MTYLLTFLHQLWKYSHSSFEVPGKGKELPYLLPLLHTGVRHSFAATRPLWHVVLGCVCIADRSGMWDRELGLILEKSSNTWWFLAQKRLRASCGDSLCLKDECSGNTRAGKWKGEEEGEGNLWIYSGYQITDSLVRNKLWTILSNSNTIDRKDKIFLHLKKEPLPNLFLFWILINYASCDNRTFQTPLEICMLNRTLIRANSFRKSHRDRTLKWDLMLLGGRVKSSSWEREKKKGGGARHIRLFSIILIWHFSGCWRMVAMSQVSKNLHYRDSLYASLWAVVLPKNVPCIISLRLSSSTGCLQIWT